VQDSISERARSSAARQASGQPGPADRAETQEAAELLAAVSALRRAARRAARRTWEAEPLPPAQSELLRLAAHMPGLTVAEAAAELRLAPNTVSTLVGKLTDQGLLKRVPSRTDGRSILLEVTRKARKRLAEWRDLRAELGGQALAGLPGEDRAALASAVPAMLRLAEQMAARQG
jgi:DNA-binding MarR family transcriptional regulator